MISEEAKQKLAKYFGLKTLDSVGNLRFRDDDGNDVELDTSLIWIAEVLKYGTLTPSGRQDFLVAVVKTEKWRRGVLLVPASTFVSLHMNIEVNEDDYMGASNLRALDLLHDPVEDRLKSINLSYAYDPKNTRTEQAHTFELCVRTPVMRSDLSIHTDYHGEDEQQGAIWGSILSVIKQLLVQYDREDMNAFFEVKRM